MAAGVALAALAATVLAPMTAAPITPPIKLEPAIDAAMMRLLTLFI